MVRRSTSRWISPTPTKSAIATPKSRIAPKPDVLEDAVALDVGERREQHAGADQQDRRRTAACRAGGCGSPRAPCCRRSPRRRRAARAGGAPSPEAPRAGRVRRRRSRGALPGPDRREEDRLERDAVRRDRHHRGPGLEHLAQHERPRPSRARGPRSGRPSAAAARRSAPRAPRPARRARRRARGPRAARRRPRRSSIGPSWTIRPRAMIATRSQASSTSERMCVFMNTVLPSARSCRIRSRISLRPIGSRPLIGSSRKTTRGSWTSACAIPIRCSMPFE